MILWPRISTVICAIILTACLLGGCCGRDRTPGESSLPTETVSGPAPAAEQTVITPTAPIRDDQAMKAAAQAEALTTIYFDFDRFDIRPPADTALKTTAAWLLKNPAITIEIAGHCDERGTNEYNMALGERRANAARKYLTEQGIASTRMRTVSYGEERPVDSGHDETAWSKNRRAEFTVYQ